MRLGVLDVGSNTVHLLVVDAHRGAHPTPMTSEKTVLRLAERIGAHGGRLSEDDAGELIRTVAAAQESAVAAGCEELMAFATSAIRDAVNAAEVLDRVEAETGIALEVLPGEDEARFTFLAARRWYGWSAGNLLMLDIGGGSLEMAMGIDEQPDLAVSLPLGAGRMARTMLHDPPGQDEVKKLREWLQGQLAPTAKQFRKLGRPDRAVASSKTFRSLARLTGAAPASAGPRAPRTLTETGLRQLIAFISRMSSPDLAALDGVSAARAHQLVGGALVAEATMKALGVKELDICPWALREGVILRRLDHTNGDSHTAIQDRAALRLAGPDEDGTGRRTEHGARWER
ncbi:exopolyphosphatase / guanosine-5'-triphosphate,3'-diphosphate pyrophosphatase [Saccharopolyspora kobensis]|uniref:Exopolyphosphatase / guanosine-5'-triphosphate,3'-diphosphate pyrophosphatase n=1 Tax=Saccharopolyspora kobensis TaxID=146035 RepID=A0A1H6DXT5_9PSEU|nr:Ppx/GppA phosphatase family protein [Saccharopolyspora kobensis]SEG90098.1 exopolyphosphatase / guanosine-5'-triphosphate,3'-diphosphate pyrophosphatase [Saccharopolyspora kobensis]SFD89039.1 Ppx/GppA phosphatase [Saccharopolyspora kobensis]